MIPFEDIFIIISIIVNLGAQLAILQKLWDNVYYTILGNFLRNTVLYWKKHSGTIFGKQQKKMVWLRNHCSYQVGAVALIVK